MSMLIAVGNPTYFSVNQHIQQEKCGAGFDFIY